MNILQEALTALLSGLTKKIGNEIHWKDEYGRDITIEPIDISQEKYIIRHYYGNGKKHLEYECCRNELHGKYIIYYYNSGNIMFTDRYVNGKLIT